VTDAALAPGVPSPLPGLRCLFKVAKAPDCRIFVVEPLNAPA
jgi:hypothetical protein